MTRALLAVLLCCCCGGASAEAELLDKLQLQLALKSGPPCCVIDGRRPASRAKHPLAEALPYTEGMKIEPTAAVVVVADNDRLAKGIAEALAKDYPGKRILAVKGGVGVWESVLAALARMSGRATAFGFVIPKNTCESGTTLQHLRSAPVEHK